MTFDVKEFSKSNLAGFVAGLTYVLVSKLLDRVINPRISNIIGLFEDLGSKLGTGNPYEAAESSIDKIYDVLSETSLGGEFPDIPNPLSTSMIPNLPTFNNNTAGLPPLPNPSLVNNTQFGTIDPVSRLTLAEDMYLDPLGKAYRKKQRQPNQTKLT